MEAGGLVVKGALNKYRERESESESERERGYSDLYEFPDKKPNEKVIHR